jgi:ethanolamine utilization cobalamin adenosyltransferase
VKKVFGIEHPIPNYQMGRLCVALNSLRTQVREAELSAARAFSCGDSCSRSDLIEGLNRMSSCVYIILCRKLSGYY